MGRAEDDISLENRKQRLLDRAAPLMGEDDAQRLTTILRPGAAPTLATLAARGKPERGTRARRRDGKEQR